MKRLLLDTIFLIDSERGTASADLIDDDDDVVIAAISVAEMLVGVELSQRRTKDTRETFLNGVLTALPVVSYDLEIARGHAELLVAVRRAGRPRGSRDLVIAATALAARRMVVTAHPNGFNGLPRVVVLSHK